MPTVWNTNSVVQTSTSTVMQQVSLSPEWLMRACYVLHGTTFPLAILYSGVWNYELPFRLSGRWIVCVNWSEISGEIWLMRNQWWSCDCMAADYKSFHFSWLPVSKSRSTLWFAHVHGRWCVITTGRIWYRKPACPPACGAACIACSSLHWCNGLNLTIYLYFGATGETAPGKTNSCDNDNKYKPKGTFDLEKHFS